MKIENEKEKEITSHHIHTLTHTRQATKTKETKSTFKHTLIHSLTHLLTHTHTQNVKEIKINEIDNSIKTVQTV